MPQNVNVNLDTSLLGKRKALLDAFLLFRYNHSSTERKQSYEQESRPERIARTMCAEGDMVSAEDVRGFLARSQNNG